MKFPSPVLPVIQFPTKKAATLKSSSDSFSLPWNVKVRIPQTTASGNPDPPLLLRYRLFFRVQTISE